MPVLRYFWPGCFPLYLPTMNPPCHYSYCLPILTIQLGSWYDREAYGAYKQVDTRSAANTRVKKILGATTSIVRCEPDRLDLQTGVHYKHVIPRKICLQRIVEYLEYHAFGEKITRRPQCGGFSETRDFF